MAFASRAIPILRRILMWEGFAGHPLRKDWKEAYFEGDKSRSRAAIRAVKHKWAEERVPWADNLNYPAGYPERQFDPDGNL